MAALPMLANATSAPAPSGSAAVALAKFLHLYYTPLLVALGSVGNLLSMFVFCRSKLRFQSTSQHLSALALSDTLFLVELLPPWLNAMHINGLFHRNGFCQIFVYTSYVTCSFSAWLVVTFTIERFVAVLYPKRHNTVFTLGWARYIIAAIALGSLFLNVPVLQFAIPTTNDCKFAYIYVVHAARFKMVHAAVSFTVPLAVIIVLNTWIMVCWLERARQQLTKAERQMEVLGSHTIRKPGFPHSQQRVTRMLLIVSSVFVCLNLPTYIMRIIAYAYDMDEGDGGGWWAALQQVAVMIYNTKFGINFLLYCLSGQNFRQALRHTVPRLQTTHHPSTTSTSFTSNCTEGTSNYGGASGGGARRRRPEQNILRCTFDNSRQRRRPPRSPPAAPPAAPPAPPPTPPPRAPLRRPQPTAALSVSPHLNFIPCPTQNYSNL